jgi:hypothetical protein
MRGTGAVPLFTLAIVESQQGRCLLLIKAQSCIVLAAH